MEVTPKMRAARFEKLEPGDLFIYLTDRRSCFALKTEKTNDGDPSDILVLGPDFPYDAKESMLLRWQPTTVVSFGKDYKIVLPTKPSEWFLDGNVRTAVCLAVCDEDVYVCTNGGPSPNRFFQCFVEVKTGKIIENRLPGIVAYTNRWDIALPGAELKTILRYSDEGVHDGKP
jgi:hypothetical protein